jgi:hypothetical protein
MNIVEIFNVNIRLRFCACVALVLNKQTVSGKEVPTRHFKLDVFLLCRFKICLLTAFNI